MKAQNVTASKIRIKKKIVSFIRGRVKPQNVTSSKIRIKKKLIRLAEAITASNFYNVMFVDYLKDAFILHMAAEEVNVAERNSLGFW